MTIYKHGDTVSYKYTSIIRDDTGSSCIPYQFSAIGVLVCKPGTTMCSIRRLAMLHKDYKDATYDRVFDFVSLNDIEGYAFEHLKPENNNIGDLI